ncbi:MAG: hypothetical protein JWO91_569 [Acidobacteriaceae bacterium]|nr:hypothetical protein [Acidobacteriaceae bacterium]
MVLIPAVHYLAIPVIIPMAFASVLLVALSILTSVFVDMFIVTTPMSMTFLLCKNHNRAKRQDC